MIKILRSATQYNLSKSPVVFKLETDNLWITQNIGDKAFCTHGWSGSPSVGNAFKIQWATGSVTYTFVTTLSGPNQIRTNTGSLSTSAYTAQVVSDILLNATISSLFSVIAAAYIIEIRALNAGTIYTFSNGGNTAYTDFYNQKNGTNNIIDVQRPNYGIYIEFYVYDTFSGTTSKLIHKTLKKFSTPEPVLKQELEIEISEILNAFLDYDIPKAGSSTAFLCENVLKRFYFHFLEMYGEPPTWNFSGVQPYSYLISPYSNGYSIDGYILKAGFSRKHSKLIDKEQFTNYYHLNKSFLTRQPRTKKIVRHQPEYLYFVLPIDYPGQNLCILVNSIDAADNIVSISPQSITTGPLLKNGAWCFPINFPGSFIATDNNLKYTVWVGNVLNPSVPLSEVFTYQIDEDFYLDEKIIMFTNSDGGFDTWRSLGKVKKGLDYDKENYSSIISLYDSSDKGENNVGIVTEQEKYKCSSGFLTQSQSDWLMDLFISEKVVEYDPVNNLYTPIVITNKNLEKDETQQNIKSFELEYYYSDKGKSTNYLPYLP